MFFISTTDAAASLGEKSSAQKLGRGLVNIVTSPVEIVRGIDLTTKESTVGRGWTVGLVKGLTGTILRLGTGVIDVLTFPFEWPVEDRNPIVKPKYGWQEWYGPYLTTA